MTTQVSGSQASSKSSRDNWVKNSGNGGLNNKNTQTRSTVRRVVIFTLHQYRPLIFETMVF